MIGRRLARMIEIARLDDGRFVARSFQRLSHGTPEKRVIVGDNERPLRHASYSPRNRE